MNDERSTQASTWENGLTSAIARRQRTTITLRQPDGWTIFKGEFVSGAAAAGRIVIAIPGSLDDRTASVWGQSESLGDEPVGVTFRSGHKKAMFAARLLSVTPVGGSFHLSVAWPQGVQCFQRRAYERVEPPRGNVVPVRFWRADGEDDAATARSEIRYGQLENISAGGMRIKASDLVCVDVGCTYRCVFTPQPGAPAVVLEARLRHHEAIEHGRASLGFQFLGFELTPEGRRTLERVVRIVTQFQEHRRRRRRVIT